MKKVLFIAIAFILLITTGCEMKPIAKGSKVAGFIKDFQIAVRDDGTVIIQGEPDDAYDFSEWSDIRNISLNGFIAIGVKNDGTVVMTGRNDIGGHDITGWKDIVMADSTVFATYGLTKDGRVVHTEFDGFSELFETLDTWKDIKCISANDFGVVGLKGLGEVVVASDIVPEFSEETEGWRNVYSVSMSYFRIAAVTRNGDVLVAFSSLIDEFNDYTEPYEDMKGAVKIALGETFVAGLMPDGTVTVRSLFLGYNTIDEILGRDNDTLASLFLDDSQDIENLTKAEREAVHQYMIDHMPEDLKSIDNATDIIDINCCGDTLVALRHDGTILAAGTVEED